MTLNRWQNWVLIGAGYAAGCVIFRADLPLLESLLIALLLPSTAAAIDVSTSLILAKDPSSITDNGSVAVTYSRIVFAVVFFIVTMHALMVFALAGTLPLSSWLARAPIVLFGLLAIWVGNLLPRTRPNLALGIRTRRTLWDREAWMKTHRVAGYLAVMLGFLFVMSGALLPKQQLEIVLGPVSIAAAFLLIAEHVRSRVA